MSSEARRQAFQRWVKNHPEEWRELNRANARRYYEEHKEEILRKSQERRDKKKAEAKKKEAEQGSDSETVVLRWEEMEEIHP